MKKRSLIGLLIGSLVLITSFQNCGQGFDISEMNPESIGEIGEVEVMDELSPEDGAELTMFSANSDTVRRDILSLYLTLLDRPWSAVGEPELQYWLGFVKQYGLQAAKNSFLASDERFVAQAYRQILRRKGDQGGIQFFTGKLRSKQMTRSQLTAEFNRICSQRLNGECK